MLSGQPWSSLTHSHLTLEFPKARVVRGRKAVDATKCGSAVRIVSNDNFRDYIGELRDFNFSEDWVREHAAGPRRTGNPRLLSGGFQGCISRTAFVSRPFCSAQVVKFCFAGDDFIPADGFGEALPPMNQPKPSEQLLRRGVKEDLPHYSIPLRCVGFPAQRLWCSFQLASGSLATVEFGETPTGAREVAELAEPPGLPVLLTGRGAQHPSQLQIAAGVQEAWSAGDIACQKFELLQLDIHITWTKRGVYFWHISLLLCASTCGNQCFQVRCPHRRCPLRMSIKESKGGFVVQMTGLETPAARAEQPILKLRRQRSLKTWCPTCKRPLELRSQKAEQVPMNRCRRRGKGTAFVTVLFGPDEELLQRFVLGALVLGHSLKMSETRFDLVLLHTADVMNVPGAGLLEVYWTTREVDYLEADSKLTCRSEERFRHVFTKLQAGDPNACFAGFKPKC